MNTKPLAIGDSSWCSTLAGWLMIAGFFGGFGTWAATAPLNGAVVASGVVKVEGNRKSVQHLDGGIVRELRVKEGPCLGRRRSSRVGRHAGPRRVRGAV